MCVHAYHVSTHQYQASLLASGPSASPICALLHVSLGYAHTQAFFIEKN